MQIKYTFRQTTFCWGPAVERPSSVSCEMHRVSIHPTHKLHARKRPLREEDGGHCCVCLYDGENALFRIHVYALLIRFSVGYTRRKNVKASKRWHQQEALKNFTVDKKRRQNELPFALHIFGCPSTADNEKYLKRKRWGRQNA